MGVLHTSAHIFKVKQCVMLQLMTVNVFSVVYLFYFTFILGKVF